MGERVEGETQPQSLAKALMLRLTIALAVGLFLFIGWLCWVAFLAPQPAPAQPPANEARPISESGG